VALRNCRQVSGGGVRMSVGRQVSLPWRVCEHQEKLGLVSFVNFFDLMKVPFSSYLVNIIQSWTN
jgi:hypothetical protein